VGNDAECLEQNPTSSLEDEVYRSLVGVPTATFKAKLAIETTAERSKQSSERIGANQQQVDWSRLYLQGCWTVAGRPQLWCLL
jgi:hypothetical protein